MKSKTEQSLERDRNPMRAAAEVATVGRHPVAVMPKLEIGQPGDRYEQEADYFADRIMQMPENNVVRKSEEEEDKIQMKSEGAEVTPWLQRFGNNEALQAKADHGVEAPSWLENQLRDSKVSGNSFNGASRSFMEKRFGVDFSDVKIHTGDRADELSRSINARAFTHGRDLFFANQQFDPETNTGKRLLAHELTHVVQQRNEIRRDPPTDEEKAEADKVTKLKAAIIKSYSFKSIEDGTSSWKSTELEIVKNALSAIPATDKTVLKGVVLKRVASLGGKTGGQFSSKQGLDGTSVTNDATLELADLAFGGTDDAEKMRLVQHEVAHAIATSPYRVEQNEHLEALAKINVKVDETNVLSNQYNTENDELNTIIDDYNSRVEVYNKEKDAKAKATMKVEIDKIGKDIKSRQSKLEKLDAESKKKEAEKTKAEETAKTKGEAAEKTKIKKEDLDAILAEAEKANTNHETQLNSTKAKVTPEMKDIAEATAYLAAAESTSTSLTEFYTKTKDRGLEESEVDSLIAGIEKLFSEQTTASGELLAKKKDHPLLTLLPSLEQAQKSFFDAAKANALAHERKARVQKFVDFVKSKGIAPITPYALENWPHKPEEFYAEAYSFWVSKKLETVSADLQKWFEDGEYKK